MNREVNTFATLLNCMDGRVQHSVNAAVRARLGVAYVDTITEAGIVKHLADEPESRETLTALASIRISLNKHGSQSIAVAAHHDCAGNPKPDTHQQNQLHKAVTFLKQQFPTCTLLALWVGPDWTPSEITPPSSE